MTTVILCENPVDQLTWTTHEVENVCEFLKQHFETWPDSARIYHEQVSLANDVTPFDDFSTDRLEQLKGTLYVVVYPQGLETFLIIVAIAVAAVAVGLAFLLRPKASPNVKSQNESSPNNELSKRENRARPGERVPDIYGNLWATPDLIQVPYRIFNASGQEIEYSYMCVGRGSFTIGDVREDLTPVTQIAGEIVEIYGPNNSPNTGSAPQLRVGLAAISEPIRIVKPLSSINGQTLIAPNLAGGGNFAGPFIIGDNNITEVWCNFVAQSGCYLINGTGAQASQSATLRVGLTPCDASGTATGAEVTHDVTLIGSAVTKSRLGVTLKITLPASGTYKIRASRVSNTTIVSGDSVVDEIQWRDCLSIAPVAQLHFGNVTTVQSVTFPTPNALAIKSRKLNMFVVRNVLKGTLAGGAVTFSLTKLPSTSAADAIYDIALDSKLGNRQASELDLVGIYQAMTDVQTYFGTDLCTRFCYTFDDSKVSFEEMLTDIAAAIFCTAYRRGAILSLFFERSQVNSKMLFNHRNKIPRSEVRTIQFGTFQDNDGISLDYIEPNATNAPNQDTQVTLYFPEDQSAINPRKITAVGVRNNVQAKILGWRYYQKLKFQNTAVEFEATHEAAMRIVSERILVADNTRPDTIDGEIVAQNGLILTLSQDRGNMPATYTVGISVININYTIYIQHYDDTVEALGCTNVIGHTNQVALLSAPSIPLVMGPETFARTTFILVSDGPPTVKRDAAFLISEKTPAQKNTYNVKGVNYDTRYYSHDNDFIGGLIIYTGDTPVSIGIAPGATYRPSFSNDLGVVATVNPANVYDANNATFARLISQWTIDDSGPPEVGHNDVCECAWAGFPSISLSGDTTLHIKYNAAASDPSFYSIVAPATGLVFLADSGTEITYKVLAGTNLATIDFYVTVSADTFHTVNQVDIDEAWIL